MIFDASNKSRIHCFYIIISFQIEVALIHFDSYASGMSMSDKGQNPCSNFKTINA
jgi:hypothetical protein